jgi:hypothetical protein
VRICGGEFRVRVHLGWMLVPWRVKKDAMGRVVAGVWRRGRD